MPGREYSARAFLRIIRRTAGGIMLHVCVYMDFFYG